MHEVLSLIEQQWLCWRQCRAGTISKMREFVLRAQGVLLAPFLTAIKLTAQPGPARLPISMPRKHD